MEFLAFLDMNHISLLKNNFYVDNSINENYILEQINLRNNYKLQKNYEYADKIRDDLKAQNIILEDIAGNKTIFHRIK
jgi:cysteinyl-tRNA synthetase